VENTRIKEERATVDFFIQNEKKHAKNQHNKLY